MDLEQHGAHGFVKSVPLIKVELVTFSIDAGMLHHVVEFNRRWLTRKIRTEPNLAWTNLLINVAYVKSPHAAAHLLDVYLLLYSGLLDLRELCIDCLLRGCRECYVARWHVLYGSWCLHYLIDLSVVWLAVLLHLVHLRYFIMN